MIKAKQKPIAEIKTLIAPYKKILILGCGTCVTISFAGGEKEVGMLASSLRIASAMEGQDKTFAEATVQRQCEWEFIDAVADQINKADAVISLACGIGVQALAERYPDKVILPGVNTTFLGMAIEHGVLVERCRACGDCVLGLTAGVCPIARCAKNLLNGPCGGSHDGKCEVNPETDCAWQLIYDRLGRLGQLQQMDVLMPSKDWSKDYDGGPRKIVREDLKL
jgi:ferredoxin